MSEKKTVKTVSVFGPGMEHLKTEEGAKRFDRAVAQRNQADFECFRVLRELADNAAIYGGTLRSFLAAAFKGSGDDAEVQEMVDYHVEEIQEALEKRRAADVEFSNALMGK